MRRAVVMVGVLAACGSPPATTTAFYSQRITDGGIPILAHRVVSAAAMQAARDQLELVLHAAPRIRRNLEAGHYELHVLGMSQFPSDLPEYRTKRGTILDNGDTFDHHMVGGHISEGSGHFSSCTEATLVPVVGHGLFESEVCVHELAHAIEWFALDGRARAQIFVEFEASLKDGHWRGKYAATNVHEWFAEITRYYFRADRPDLAFYDPGLVDGHDWFCAYDRRACEFAAAVYSDRIDPGTPVTVALQPGAADREGSLRSGDGRIPVRVVVRNSTAQRIHLIWIDADGKRDARRPFAAQQSAAPGDEIGAFTWSTHAFVVTDDAEKGLYTIVAPDQDALVDVR